MSYTFEKKTKWRDFLPHYSKKSCLMKCISNSIANLNINFTEYTMRSLDFCLLIQLPQSPV